MPLNNNVKKLVFFDMDGTLLNSKKVFNPATVKAIKDLKEKNFIFCIATGRALSEGILEFAEMLELDDYLVLANGSYVWDIKNQILATLGLPLSHSVIQMFYEKAVTYKRQLNFFFEDGSIKYYYFGEDPNQDIKDPNFFKIGPTIYNFSNPDTISLDIQKPIIHVGIKAEAEIVEKVYEEVQSLEVLKLTQISKVLNTYVDAEPYGISKWNGIEYVQRKLNIANENTYAFGDSGNDLIMLKNVGHGVAMGNSKPEIKMHCRYVIGDNNSDAIAEALYQIANDTFKPNNVITQDYDN